MRATLLSTSGSGASGTARPVRIPASSLGYRLGTRLGSSRAPPSSAPAGTRRRVGPRRATATATSVSQRERTRCNASGAADDAAEAIDALFGARHFARAILWRGGAARKPAASAGLCRLTRSPVIVSLVICE